MSPDRRDYSSVLRELEEGADAAQLVPELYGELRVLAHRMLTGERRRGTLQTTALVHEVYLKLAPQTRTRWKGRSHFLAVATQVLRRILVDHARARLAERRPPPSLRVELDDELPTSQVDCGQLLEIHDVVERLRGKSERQARIAELRIFGGLSTSEIAEAVGTSERTIKSDWSFAKAWLRREVSHGR